MNKQKTITQAINLIGSWNLAGGNSQAFSDFVFYWAFAHTNQHKQETEFGAQASEKDGVVELAQLLTDAMLNGYSDPIGDILIQLGVNEEPKQNNKLEGNEILGQMMGLNENEIYEPFCGTGSLTMEQMQVYCEKNMQQNNPLSAYTYHLEEIKPLNCAAAVIQIFHKLEYLSMKFNAAVIPAHLKIINIDPLTRKEGTQHYVASKMSEAETINYELMSRRSCDHSIH